MGQHVPKPILNMLLQTFPVEDMTSGEIFHYNFLGVTSISEATSTFQFH